MSTTSNKALPEVLSQILGDGIHAAMLLTVDGALMGAVGAGEGVDHKVIGAIAVHTWSEYVHAGHEFYPANSKGLEALLVEMEHGRVAVSSASKGFLVCAYTTTTDTPLGLLKAKVQALSGFLGSSLDQIQVE